MVEVCLLYRIRGPPTSVNLIDHFQAAGDRWSDPQPDEGGVV